jgi:hypothetical protein
MIKRALSVLLLACALPAADAIPLHAQQSHPDLTDLSLEELLQVNVISLNVLGTHTHLAGQWMVSYEFMDMGMKGNRDGTSRVSNDQVLSKYMVSPTDMSFQVHMPALMYAPTDELTLMAMLPIYRKSMNHNMDDGGMPMEKTSGIGDLGLTALYTFYSAPELRHRLLLNASVNIPTGSIDEMMDDMRMEYPMQLGSGSYEIAPGITYLGQTRNWGDGAEFIPQIRLNNNSNGYRLGNQYHAKAWVARRLTDWLSASTKIEGDLTEKIHGVDAELDPMDEPTKDVNAQGGKQVGLSLGLNLFAPNGALAGHRLSIEGTVPVYRNLNGPQLETDWQLRIGWQWIFKGFQSAASGKLP